MKPKFTIFVEDYNVPLSPWYILGDRVFSKDLREMTDGRIMIDNLFIFEKDFALWGPDAEQFQRAGDYFYQKLHENKDFLKTIIKGHERSFKEIKRIVKILLTEDLKAKTNEELFEIYKDSYHWFAEAWKWGMIPPLLDMGRVKYSEKIKKDLMDKLKTLGDSEVVFSKLVTPTKETTVKKEQLEILKAVKDIQDDKNLLKEFKSGESFSDLREGLRVKIDDLKEKFGWMQYYFIGPAAGVDYYFNVLKKRIDDDVEEEMESIKKEKEELEEFQKKSKTVFTKEEIFNIEILREFLYLKGVRKEIQVAYLNFAMHNWYKEISRRFHWSPLQARYIVKDEFAEILLKGKMVVDADILNERYNYCAYLLENGETTLVAGEKAKEMKKLFIKEEKPPADIKEIKGAVAYGGKAKAVVKIVNSTSDLDKFNEGDVLVSFATNPSLVPAMNKASAIITDTGGVTCHAAIVSRELKIPCVIGTKIATKVLKDGDLVEVDAEKGVVKILTKKVFHKK